MDCQWYGLEAITNMTSIIGVAIVPVAPPPPPLLPLVYMPTQHMISSLITATHLTSTLSRRGRVGLASPPGERPGRAV